jgi:hypothetical protein
MTLTLQLGLAWQTHASDHVWGLRWSPRGFAGGLQLNGASAQGCRLGGPYLLTHHVEDRLLPLKQTVRHPLDPRTKLH